MPVKVLNDEGKGVTRDVSSSGVFFETDKHYEVGSIITMTIDLENPPGTRLRCVGTIVRLEDRGSRVGVAVHMKVGESKILTVGPPEKI
jgi:Tfp pilus assembly protein PilZ